jgi:hypothetical protein
MNIKIINEQTINKYICDKCNFNCNYMSEWNKHINTELHITGIKKKRSDYKEPFKCINCNYITKTNTNLKKHYLNTHANREERKKEFTYFCENCDIGTFSKKSYEIHLNSSKHIKTIERLK